MIITVQDHKTSSTTPLDLVLTKEQIIWMVNYNNLVTATTGRKQFKETSTSNEDNAKMYTPFFVNGKGHPCQLSFITRFFRGTDRIARKTGKSQRFKKFTANNVRKAYATSAETIYGKNSHEAKLVADYMTHNYETAKRHYVQKGLHEKENAAQMLERLHRKTPFDTNDDNERKALTVEATDISSVIYEQVI